MVTIKDFNFISEVRESRLIRVHFERDEVGNHPSPAEFIEDTLGIPPSDGQTQSLEFIGFRLGEQAKSVRPLREDSALYANLADILPHFGAPGFGKSARRFADRFGPLFDVDTTRKMEESDISHGQIIRIKNLGSNKLLVYNLFTRIEEVRLLEPDVEKLSTTVGEQYYIEALFDWFAPINDFFRLCEIWQNIQSGEIEYFHNIVGLDWTEGPRNFWTEFQAALSSCGSDDRLLFSTAKKTVLQHLEQKLVGSFSVGIEGSDFTLKPSSLFAAMYLQFANAFTGFDEGAFIKRCEVCGTWFELSARAGRPEKTYCSDACRMRAYRKRKAAFRET